MKKISLIKNPELFQGEKYLNTNKNYFEGWYFKHTNDKNGISFIPGISINKKEKKAFIQVITTTNSYYINYNIADFSFSHNPFYIKIGKNYFSKENIHIDITDSSQNLIIYGDIKYKTIKNINTTTLSPNIMGPFSYVPFMECNHAIISMQSNIDGCLKINHQKLIFNNDTGYIEKDWGTSFPKTYVWIQGNNFKNKNVSFMLSIADIPFKTFHFQGIICTLLINDKEYRFATYNNTKIVNQNINNNSLNITLQKGKYIINIKSKYDKGLKLIAPVKGKMTKDILESISSTVTITIKKKNKVIFKDTSINCGLEIVY